MRISSLVISAALIVGVAGCAKEEGAEFVMRNADGATAEHIVLQEQAVTLTQMTRDIVRKSTLNGAALGAVAGCGLAAVSTSNAGKCVGGLVAGAAAGAALGHAHGTTQASKRMQLVSPSALVRSIGKTSDQVAQIEMTLPSLLAAQDIELSDLTKQMEQGAITAATFAARADQIRADRSALSQALMLSAAQARTAYDNLKAAQAQGQAGLDWHINATRHLSEDVLSARSTISLL